MELSEARRHAANEAHRLKARLTAAAQKATEAKAEANRLAAELQVLRDCSLLHSFRMFMTLNALSMPGIPDIRQAGIVLESDLI